MEGRTTRPRSRGHVQVPEGFGRTWPHCIYKNKVAEYAIGRKLGEGGQGMVFSAYSMLSGNMCAIKLFPFRHSRCLAAEAAATATAVTAPHFALNAVADEDFEATTRDSFNLSGAEREIDVLTALDSRKSLTDFLESDGRSPSHTFRRSRREERRAGESDPIGGWRSRLARLLHIHAEPLRDNVHLIKMRRVIERVRVGEDEDEEDGNGFWATLIELELAENGDIATFLQPLRAAEGFSVQIRHHVARFFSRQLFEALNWLHAKGVYHRDLKLSNLLLDESYKLKLGDFGLSFAREDERGSGLTHSDVGTAAIKAPEVDDADEDYPYSPEKADVWSCGICLAMLLTAKKPFQLADDADGNFRRWKLTVNTAARPDQVAHWTEYLLTNMHGTPPAAARAEVQGAASLIASMLQLDPARRITMAEATGHRWLRSSSAARREEEIEVKKLMAALKKATSSGASGGGDDSWNSSELSLPPPPPASLLTTRRTPSEQVASLAEREFGIVAPARVPRSAARGALDDNSQDQDRALADLGRRLLTEGLSD